MSEPRSRTRVLSLLFGLVAPIGVLCANLWPVSDYTVDDAFIAFRYARNLARGAGLVYNVGERVEGYSNLLWTLALALFSVLGVPIELASKLLGTGAAIALVIVVYALSRRHDERALPPIAPWLVASSITLTGFAMSGLETIAWVCALYAALGAIVVERDDETRRPWSAVWLAIAILLRPETPLYAALLVGVCCGWPKTPRDVVRVLLPLAALLGQFLFRYLYYGTWLPMPMVAKTGHFAAQLATGLNYTRAHLRSIWPILFGALGGAVVLWRRGRAAWGLAGLALLPYLLVLYAGADWMAGWRYLAPAEPALFVLCDVAIGGLYRMRTVVAPVAVAAMLIAGTGWRALRLRDQQRELVLVHKARWDQVVPPTVAWLLSRPPGLVAIGDIGEVGWRTDYPIFDLVGLVTPEVARARHANRNAGAQFLRAQPRYLVAPSDGVGCHPIPQLALSLPDGALPEGYRIEREIHRSERSAWCLLAYDGDSR